MNRNEKLEYLYENRELIVFTQGIEYWHYSVDEHFPNSDVMRVGERYIKTNRLLYELSHGHFPTCEDEAEEYWLGFTNYTVHVKNKNKKKQ
jgi:hypothetical protein